MEGKRAVKYGHVLRVYLNEDQTKFVYQAAQQLNIPASAVIRIIVEHARKKGMEFFKEAMFGEEKRKK